MRDSYPKIRAADGEVVAVGTGNPSLASAFVDKYEIPYPVLVDRSAAAARVVALVEMPFWKMFHPATWSGTKRAWSAGHRIGMPGDRVTQLGSTFVLGPGPKLHYSHRDAHSADHAPLPALLGALKR